MVVCGLTDAPIPWPTGKRRGRKSHSIILYGPLIDAVLKETAQAIDAVLKETAQAVAYWWGVGRDTVWKWRKALEVKRCNEGTRELRQQYSRELVYVASIKKAQAKAGDLDRRKKIAASRRGKRRPRHVVEAIIEAHKGRKASEETRRKMSESHRERWARER